MEGSKDQVLTNLRDAQLSLITNLRLVMSLTVLAVLHGASSEEIAAALDEAQNESKASG